MKYLLYERKVLKVCLVYTKIYQTEGDKADEALASKEHNLSTYWKSLEAYSLFINECFFHLQC